MTGGAILPEPALVLIILPMARETILRRRLQIRKGARIEMTFCASHIDMSAIQLERESGMVEVIPEPVHPVVTGEAVRAKCEKMRLGKGDIHLTMTIIAGLR